MRVTLVVNRHDAVSETFQRSLAALLVAAGHEVTIHALRAEGGAGAGGPDSSGADRSVGLPPMKVRSAGQLLARVVGRGDAGLATAARRARAKYGATARAARAALYAGPIIATRPDVIHLGFSGLGVALADVLPLLSGARVVVSCRGTDELVRPLFDEGRAADLGALLRSADLVHAVADAVADAVVALGAPAENVRVIRPAVDLDRWPMRSKPGGRAGLAVVAVARLEPAKGLEDLIAAIGSVRNDGIDARLRIVGAGPHRGALELRIARSELEGVVTLVGAVAPPSVRRELVDADVFASPSLSEGISNGVLEAMATGVAVVSTAVGGMAEVITGGVDGWLVPAGRPDRLAAALVNAARDQANRQSVAAAGRRRVEEAFGLGRQRGELVALYEELDGLAERTSHRRIAVREDDR